MELLTCKNNSFDYTYCLNNGGEEVLYGGYKAYHPNGQLWVHLFYYHGLEHGECKWWDKDGKQTHHCFFINGNRHPYVEMSEQEKLLFQIQHPGFQFIEE